MDVVVGRIIRNAAPLFTALASALLLLTLAAILQLGKELFIPLALAVLLSFALSPVATALERRGVGRGASTAISLLSALAIIVGVGYLIGSQVSALAGDLPKYSQALHAKVRGLGDMLGGGGPFSRAAAVLTDVFADLEKLGAGAKTEAPPTPVIIRTEHGGNLTTLGDYLSPLLGPTATLFEVLLLSAFMLGQRGELRNRVIRLAGSEDLQRTTAAFDDAGRRVGGMLLSQLAINSIFGLLIGSGLWLIGLPSPFLWGALAGILRFAPYIGAILGVLPPLFIAFASDPSWTSFLWTAGLFVLVEPVIGHFVEPMIYGKSSGLSPLSIVVSTITWAFLWGPVGLVLATPLTIILVVIGRHIEKLAFLEILLGDKPALQPPEMFYQRMLAGDPMEAREQAVDFLEQRALATYYDAIALPALRRAHLDIVRGEVSGDRLATVQRSIRSLVESVGDHAARLSRRKVRPKINPEAEAAFELVRADSPAALTRLDAQSVPLRWRSNPAVAVVYGDDPLDASAALMLSQTFNRHGLAAKAATFAQAQEANAETIGGVALICLSYVEPLSFLHLRAASLAAHKAAPKAHVMIAIWRDQDAERRAEMVRKLRVDALVSTMNDALMAADRFIAREPVSN
jgi:predicted PurR-regulated permease PerM